MQKNCQFPMAPSINDNPPGDYSEDENDEFPSINPAVIIDFESEEESDQEEVIQNLGYELLPQEPEIESTTPGLEPIKLENVMNKRSEVSALGPTCETQDTQSRPMDQEHIDKIKAAMSGFHLPITSIPPWAIEIPEERWKEHLLAKINKDSAQCAVRSNVEAHEEEKQNSHATHSAS